MGKPVEEGSTIQAGVTKSDRDKPNVRQPNATGFARFCLFELRGMHFCPSMRVFQISKSQPSPPPPLGERKRIGKDYDDPDARM